MSARRILGAIGATVTGAVLLACSWLSKPSHYADMARILTCISAEAAAGKSPEAIALTCGLENADAVIDLVTKSQGVASAAPKMAKPAPSASSGAK